MANAGLRCANALPVSLANCLLQNGKVDDGLVCALRSRGTQLSHGFIWIQYSPKIGVAGYVYIWGKCFGHIILIGIHFPASCLAVSC